MRIRAITLWNPWATLMAIGAKAVETRSWAPSPDQLAPGDLLAIHAARRWQELDEQMCCEEPFATALREGGIRPCDHERCNWPYLHGNMPFCAVVAVVRYENSYQTPVWEHRTTDRHGRPATARINWVEKMSPEEQAFGDFSPGRYGWVTNLVHRLDPPIPARGAQGLWWWDMPEEIEAALRQKGAL